MKAQHVLDNMKTYLEDKHREYSVTGNVVQAATTKCYIEKLKEYEGGRAALANLSTVDLIEPYSVRYVTGEGISITRNYTTITEALHIAKYVEANVEDYLFAHMAYRGTVIMNRKQFETELSKVVTEVKAV